MSKSILGRSRCAGKMCLASLSNDPTVGIFRESNQTNKAENSDSTALPRRFIENERRMLRERQFPRQMWQRQIFIVAASFSPRASFAPRSGIRSGGHLSLNDSVRMAAVEENPRRIVIDAALGPRLYVPALTNFQKAEFIAASPCRLPPTSGQSQKSKA